MTNYNSAFIEEITARGFIHQATDIDNLDKILFENNNIPAYIGLIVLRQVYMLGH